MLRAHHPTVRTLVSAALALAVTGAVGLYAPREAPQEPLRLQTAAVGVVAPPATTTTVERHVQPPRAARSEKPVTRNPVPVAMDAAFWRRLANCECSTGHCGGPFLGYVQFSRDTARKVGWFAPKPTPPADREWTYDEQIVMAQRWLAMIGGPARGGTRSGWPVCWWRALR